MYTGRTYSLWTTLKWTSKDILIFTLLAAIPTSLYILLDWTWLAIPALPVSVVGIAVAFNIGFKNNNSYDRLWEARKIWGAIVNASRSWGIMTLDYVSNIFTDSKASEQELNEFKKTLIHNHIAWLTALRHQLRTRKSWEHPIIAPDRKSSGHYIPYELREQKYTLEEELTPLLSSDDADEVLGKSNRATHILKLQSRLLRTLREKYLIDDFRHVEMQNILVEFYTLQGKSERIKNFPLPRQYATVSLFFVWIFIILIPFSLLGVFQNFSELHVWLTIPASVLICWVFYTMERIGDYSENPFEGSYNDVPITNLSRTIEIDLREMLDEKDIPEPISPTNNILT